MIDLLMVLFCESVNGECAFNLAKLRHILVDVKGLAAVLLAADLSLGITVIDLDLASLY